MINFNKEYHHPDFCEALSTADALLLTQLVVMEIKNVVDIEITDFLLNDLTTNIIKKRIEHFELPIQFSPYGFLYVGILAQGNIGKAVVTLIDSLTVFEDKIVGVKELIDLLG